MPASAASRSSTSRPGAATAGPSPVSRTNFSVGLSASRGAKLFHAALSMTIARACESLARYSTSSAVSRVEVGTLIAPRFIAPRKAVG